MANKRQRKKAAQKAAMNAIHLERQRAGGGRSRGRKNLIYTDDGNIINQEGVTFSLAEKKRLESLVASANKKRRDMLKAETSLPRSFGGKQLNGTVGDLRLMGKESDFIIAPKTKSLQRFKSREQFERYIANLERVTSKDYLSERTKLYKRNYIQTLRENYAYDDVKDIIMKIKTMPQDKYRELVASEETMEIRYLGSDDVVHGALAPIRSTLGLKPLEEDVYSEFYD